MISSSASDFLSGLAKMVCLHQADKLWPKTEGGGGVDLGSEGGGGVDLGIEGVGV